MTRRNKWLQKQDRGGYFNIRNPEIARVAYIMLLAEVPSIQKFGLPHGVQICNGGEVLANGREIKTDGEMIVRFWFGGGGRASVAVEKLVKPEKSYYCRRGIHVYIPLEDSEISHWTVCEPGEMLGWDYWQGETT